MIEFVILEFNTKTIYETVGMGGVAHYTKADVTLDVIGLGVVTKKDIVIPSDAVEKIAQILRECIQKEIDAN